MFTGFSLIPFDHCLGETAASFEEYAERAAASLPDGERSFVCGESFGGPIALTLARRYPERVRGLILLSTFARLPHAGSLRARVGVPLWSLLVQHTPILARGSRILGMPGQFGRPVSVATAMSYIREPLASGPDYRRKVEMIATFDALPWIAEVKCPSLVLHGRRDPVVPINAGRELGRILPTATMHELDCGHLGYLALPDTIRAHVEHWHKMLCSAELPHTAG